MNNIPVETVKFSRKAYELPLLKTIMEFGGEVVPGDELYYSIAEKMGFVDNQGDYDITHAKPKWVYTLQWVRFQLTKTGEIDGKQWGVWRITDLGIQRVNAEWSCYDRNQYIDKPTIYSITDETNQSVIPHDLSVLADHCIDAFYQNLENKIIVLELQDILSRVNPYVLYLTGKHEATSLIESILDDIIAIEGESSLNELVLIPLSNQTESQLNIMQLLREAPSKSHIRFTYTKIRTIHRLSLDFFNNFLKDDDLYDYEKLIQYSIIDS